MAESSTATNAPEFTVSELSGTLRRVVEDTFGNVRVRGELGRVSRPGSGHVYLDLKDDRAVLAGVIWKGVAGRLKVQPEQGLEVVATGKLTTFPGQSKYQIVIDSLEPAGAGALMALLEERKRKLAAEGLFAEERKQLLPYMPKHIGVVTSPTGAVIRDVLHRLSDRFPVRVTVWPVRVQGETSGMEVANGIAGLNSLPPADRPELIIVARGGGSLEDLWGFNEEAVVRAAAASDLPLISAVGHETDWTLIDYTADVRAPTPTGAAEMAVPVRADLVATVSQLAARLAGATSRSLDLRRNALRPLARSIASPERVLEVPRQRLDQATARHGLALKANLSSKRAAFDRMAAVLRPGQLRKQLAQQSMRLDHLGSRLARAQALQAQRWQQSLEQTTRRLSPSRVEQIVRDQGRNLDRLEATLQRGTARVVDGAHFRFAHLASNLGEVGTAKLQRSQAQVDALDRLLHTLSYKSAIRRGYALVRDEDGKMIAGGAGLKAGSRISIEWSDATRTAVLSDAPATPKTSKAGKPDPKSPPKAQTTTQAATKTTAQGDLF
ncbi:MAG: exodeoxyribonuclease VII large subunit [Pseudomonadota bacterium]